MYERDPFFLLRQNKSSNILNDLKIQKGRFFIVSSHREENVDYRENLISFLDSLNGIAANYKLPIIYAGNKKAQENVKNTLNEISDLIMVDNIRPTLEEEKLKQQQANAH